MIIASITRSPDHVEHRWRRWRRWRWRHIEHCPLHPDTRRCIWGMTHDMPPRLCALASCTCTRGHRERGHAFPGPRENGIRAVGSDSCTGEEVTLASRDPPVHVSFLSIPEDTEHHACFGWSTSQDKSYFLGMICVMTDATMQDARPTLVHGSVRQPFPAWRSVAEQGLRERACLESVWLPSRCGYAARSGRTHMVSCI